jgi:hypothetical protein
MLFLRRIPEGVTRKELKRFLRSGVAGLGSQPFSLRTAVCDCSILCITDPESGTREFHGLVEVQPAPTAMRAIEALNGEHLRGQPIEVRRYRHRSPPRDDGRATATPANGAAAAPDRRRRNLKIDLVSA